MREGQGENRGSLTLDVRSAVGRVQLAAVGWLDCVRMGVPLERTNLQSAHLKEAVLEGAHLERGASL